MSTLTMYVIGVILGYILGIATASWIIITYYRKRKREPVPLPDETLTGFDAKQLTRYLNNFCRRLKDE